MAKVIVALGAVAALLSGCSVTPQTNPMTNLVVLDPRRPLLIERVDIDRYTCPVDHSMSCSAGNRISMLCQCVSARRR